MQLEIKSREELKILVGQLSSSVSAGRLVMTVSDSPSESLRNELRCTEDLLRRCEDLLENFKGEN